jgi:hypothetical protein
LYDTVNASEVPLIEVRDIEISPELDRSHMLRKNFLAAVIAEMVTEIEKASENMSLSDRWTGLMRDWRAEASERARPSMIQLTADEDCGRGGSGGWPERD